MSIVSIYITNQELLVKSIFMDGLVEAINKEVISVHACVNLPFLFYLTRVEL